MSHARWILAAILLIAIGGIWLSRRHTRVSSSAYIADRDVPVWSSTAQVHRQVGTLRYGEKVSVFQRSGDQTEIQASNGLRGWVETRELMDPSLWKQTADLLARARTLPVQAAGHTRAISNVRLGPGRESTRIFQFGRNVPVLVLEREAAAAPAADRNEEPPPESARDGKQEKGNSEDWLLVLRSDTQKDTGSTPPPTQTGASSDSAAGKPASEPSIPIAGWVLARFIELDPPSPIGDYASSMPGRVVAWQALNRVPNLGGDKTQYVVAGTRGPEGQPCDFSWLRVYTWGAERQRYETSFVENQLCGNMPLRVRQTPAGPEFEFMDDTKATRTYRLMQTVVRRVNTRPAAPPRGKK